MADRVLRKADWAGGCLAVLALGAALKPWDAFRDPDRGGRVSSRGGVSEPAGRLLRDRADGTEGSAAGLM